MATAWDSRKGLADYIKLAAILPEDYLIVLVGVTEEVKASLPQNIMGIGRTASQTDLASLYSLADVVTSLSVSESLGMTPIEGMACGTPAIVYDNTAQPELVTAEAGTVVKTGDVDAVKEAVVQITSKDKSYYTETCRQRAEQCFDKDKNYLEYIKLYHTIIKE